MPRHYYMASLLDLIAIVRDGADPRDVHSLEGCGHEHKTPEAARECGLRQYGRAHFRVDTFTRWTKPEEKKLWWLPRVHQDISRSYWVLPYRFMAGAYPGAKDVITAEYKLSGLIGAGIHSFINLMEPGETNYHGKQFTPYEALAREMAHLRGQGVMCYNYPIQDGKVPSRQRMKDILDTIDFDIKRGWRVYVHCWGGLGRTGTVVGCWLRRHGYDYGTHPINLIEYWRRGLSTHDRLSPETQCQYAFINDWKRGE